MDKKIAFVLTLACVALGVAIGKEYTAKDHTGPEINFSNTELEYSRNMDDEELLEDVIAIDKVDGDVSDTAVVEAVYTDKDAVSITYVARDKSNNITKRTRFLEKK